MFLNCNYPNEFSIPKGKPKELKQVKLEIKKDKIRLLVSDSGNVYFVENGYYFGIELPKFLVKNAFGVNIFETIGKINIALMGWGCGRNLPVELSTLSRKQEDLLQTYLLTVR